MKIALFGGSFDPVHAEHTRMAEAARTALGLDRLIVIPCYRAPHKSGAFADGADRLEMCRIAFGKLPYAEVSDIELCAGGTSYTYLTCRAFREKYPTDELYFLVGADMLEDFFRWKEPADILANVRLAAFGRGNRGVSSLQARFERTFGTRFVPLGFAGKEVSSQNIRVGLAFGKKAELDEGVADYIRARGLYAYPAIPPALALETEERREHSYRVALLAVKRARTFGISEEKALLAAALHDCGKYVPPDSPLLRGFRPPENVPAPVVHQYTGAYLAEHMFRVGDEEVLDAIRYHASGRADMTPLGKLIYLADLLEESRAFPGVEALRALFRRDLDECLRASLKHQLAHLEASGKPVYELTRQAYEWLNRNS